MSTNQDAHVPAVTYLKQLRHIITLRFILLWLFLLASGVALMELSFEKADRLFWFYLMRETGKALFITALVSVTIKFYTSSELDIHQDAKFRFLKGSVGLKLTDLKKGVQELGDRTESLGSSLVAFKRAGVASVYQNRRKAAQDIKAVLEQDGVTSIKIMGISMNDFIRDEYGDYHEAWQKIEQHIKTGEPPANSQSLEISVLIIDPSSEGAFLRAGAEQTRPATAGRLDSDVEDAIRHFISLGVLDQRSESHVKFDVRLYRTLPTVHLVNTPSTSFFELYYCRPQHGGDVDIPVFKCHAAFGPRQDHRADHKVRDRWSLHDELDFHFDWIWDNASVSLKDYWVDFSRGTDLAIRQAGVSNIYYDEKLSKERILRLIQRPGNKSLWIKGISLRSFFQFGDLFDAIREVCFRGDVDVKVLLIDPECEQAKLRSFREYLINHPGAGLEEFVDRARTGERLHIDTTQSMAQIELLNAELVARGRTASFRPRLYHSGPDAFALITDDTALVEQYHFGKITPDVAGRHILGGDVPVIEYAKIEIPADGNPLKDPYRLFRDHFRYVYDWCARDFLRPERVSTREAAAP